MLEWIYYVKKIETFENKKVLVLGLAKSGEAAARLLEKIRCYRYS